MWIVALCGVHPDGWWSTSVFTLREDVLFCKGPFGRGFSRSYDLITASDLPLLSIFYDLLGQLGCRLLEIRYVLLGL